MQNNAIKFTSYEREIMRDFAFLVAKRSIMQKVELLWAELVARMQGFVLEAAEIEEAMQFSFDSPKISKGENYLGLPYIVVDAPRYFNDEDIFTYRSMFWWGNFFSFTLLLQGEPWQNIRQECKFSLLPTDTFVSLADTPWVHHFEEGDAIPLLELSDEEREDEIRNHQFLKISRKVDIDADEEELIEYGLSTWRAFSGFVSNRF
jgi:hypothetical protein